MMRTLFSGALAPILGLVFLVSCSAPPTPDDGVRWPARGPFQVTGEEGNVTVVRLDRAGNPTTDVFGVFGDNVQGFFNAAACAADFMPCLEGSPDFGEVQFITNRNWRPVGTSDYRWVGDDMLIGPLVAEFQHDEETGVALYRAGNESRPEGAIQLRLGGEWADVNGVYASFPPDIVFTEPVLEEGEFLDLSGAPIEFRWESDGLRDLWLWVKGTPSERAVRIPDTGSYTLDPRELGLGPAERAEIVIGSSTQREWDIDGNDLAVTVLAGTAFEGSVCGDYPVVDIPNVGPTAEPEPLQPNAYLVYFEGILDEGVRDYVDGSTGVPASARLRMELFHIVSGVSVEEVCTVRYDASNAARRLPLDIEGDPHQFATFRVPLSNGETDCGEVDPTIFGSPDVRDWFEQFDWSFSLTEVEAMEPLLRRAFGDVGFEQQRDFVHGVAFSLDGRFGRLQWYGRYSDLPTCFQNVPGRALPTPEEELEVGFYQTFPLFYEALPDG